MGISVFSCFLFSCILISFMMKFFTFQFLGVAMLIVNTFAAPLPESDEEKRGTNMMQNGPDEGSDEERRAQCEKSGSTVMGCGSGMHWVAGMQPSGHTRGEGEERQTNEIENGGGKRQTNEIENGGGKRQTSQIENGGGKRQTSQRENGGEKRQNSQIENGGGKRQTTDLDAELANN